MRRGSARIISSYILIDLSISPRANADMPSDTMNCTDGPIAALAFFVGREAVMAMVVVRGLWRNERRVVLVAACGGLEGDNAFTKRDSLLFNNITAAATIITNKKLVRKVVHVHRIISERCFPIVSGYFFKYGL